METVKLKRKEDYYRVLCAKVVEKKSVNLEELKKLIEETDKETNTLPLKSSFGLKGVKESIKEIFGDYIEVERIYVKLRRGRKFDYQFKVVEQLDKNKVNVLVTKHFSKFIQDNVGLTEQSKARRDIVLKAAKGLEGDKIDRATAVSKAGKIFNFSDRYKAFIEHVFDLLSSGSCIVSGNLVKEIFQDATINIGKLKKDLEVLSSRFGLDLSDVIKMEADSSDIRKWQIVVSSPEEKLLELQKLGKDLFSLDLKFKKVKEDEKSIPFRNRIDAEYVAFIIGGLRKLSYDKLYVSTVRETINDSSFYANRGISTVEIVEVVKYFDKYFTYNTLEQVIDFKDETSWSKLNQKFNPTFKKLETTWVINSGLSQEDIEMALQDENTVVKELGEGKCQSTRIFKISTGSGIRNIQKLARLYDKLRSCDFLTDENLEKRLATVVKQNDVAFNYAYSVEGDPKFYWIKKTIKADSTLISIEAL